MKLLYKLNNEEQKEKPLGVLKINLFFTKDQYTKLCKIKNTYQLSFGTIARIILKVYCTIEILKQNCLENQLYKTTNKKTSCKVNKNADEDLNKGKVINNALIMYIDNLDSQLLNSDKRIKNPTKLYMKIRNEIANLFQTTEDPFYDYNVFVRKFAYAKKHLL